MCRPSILSEDWVTKGCHIHINRIELAVRPDHRGGVVFRAVFSSDDERDVDAAIRIATDECLPDRDERERWIRDIDRAMALMLCQTGELRNLALGRMAEFTFLLAALRRYDKEHGDT